LGGLRFCQSQHAGDAGEAATEPRRRWCSGNAGGVFSIEKPSGGWLLRGRACVGAGGWLAPWAGSGGAARSRFRFVGGPARCLCAWPDFGLWELWGRRSRGGREGWWLGARSGGGLGLLIEGVARGRWLGQPWAGRCCRAWRAGTERHADRPAVLWPWGPCSPSALWQERSSQAGRLDDATLGTASASR